MAQISIEVSGDIARRWRAASKDTRQRASQILEILINKKLMAPDEFKVFLDGIRKTMDDCGLTEEILQEILTEND